mmetsp:Transcript_13790/g.24275  ORF Transcript_13790/g.24275 Transcript_13790/m.24275 type:complete len:104 (-) Transcript_13790:401-712(-)|eukprot:CAMPEP_0175059258 /NCGR_PEP_ID=MMETSP0052_2-20121109/12329_1 /TAXON_ID=51329 ORGANISM="Polytomella parva, Strain SAG 63-3" /NCGR_SAMPLE_ID=MMETSP0052_2 /ASSEMBLY_ACC=CAM_ASM_000194 /LENGTH=103 /DNA_ID=CAMNT_0016324781 /DNA_START=166 /DNA_END=477 /DNA_ORIENTATION=-
MPADKPLSAFRVDPDTDVDFTFEEEAPNRPWKKVTLAVMLLLSGLVLLFTGLGLYLSGKSNSTGIPLLVIGSICFVPGFYYTRIAYLAWRGRKGYSLGLIPDF